MSQHIVDLRLEYYVLTLWLSFSIVQFSQIKIKLQCRVKVYMSQGKGRCHIRARDNIQARPRELDKNVSVRECRGKGCA